MAANLDGPELGRHLYPFLSEVADMRRRARQHIRNGAISSDCAANAGTVLRLLNEALATELVCVQRYRRHSNFASGTVAENVRGEFLKYAAEEQGHVEQLAQRIVQLGGEPNLQLATSTGSPEAGSPEADSLEAEALADILEEDMIAERITIESYREILQFVGGSDPATQALLESILAVESGHAEELAAMRAELLRRERAALGASSSRLPVLELN
ncbi:MAG TPA: ferritin-like domain-containing protein [Steroidobacteraceae bacterium]